MEVAFRFYLYTENRYLSTNFDPNQLTYKLFASSSLFSCDLADIETCHIKTHKSKSAACRARRNHMRTMYPGDCEAHPCAPIPQGCWTHNTHDTPPWMLETTAWDSRATSDEHSKIRHEGTAGPIRPPAPSMALFLWIASPAGAASLRRLRWARP